MDRNDFSLSYDEFADVLYLSVGAPQAAVVDEDDHGLLWRYRPGEEEPCAVTILDFKDHWLPHREALATILSQGLHLEIAIARDIIASI